MSVELKGHSVSGGKYTFSVPMIAITYVQEQETMALKSYFCSFFFYSIHNDFLLFFQQNSHLLCSLEN